IVAPQHFTRLGVEGAQRIAVAVAHEHQVAGGGEHATGPAWALLRFPDHLTRDGVPGLQPAVVGLLVVGLEGLTIHLTAEGNQRRRAFFRPYLRRHGRVVFPGRDVDQPGQRTEGVRVPGMAAGSAGPDVEGLGLVARAGGLDRPTAGIDAERPSDAGEGIAADELAGGGIQHVDETVLGGMDDDVALLAVEVQVGNHHGADGVIVPGIAGRFLVVPDVFASIGVDGHYRCDEQVVTTVRVAHLAVPGRTVAGAEVEQVRNRVIDGRVPDGAATALFPIGDVIGPGFGSHAQVIAFEAVLRIAGHGPEAPLLFAGLGIVGGNPAACAELAAGTTDEDLALGHAWRHGDGV